MATSPKDGAIEESEESDEDFVDESASYPVSPKVVSFNS